MDMLFLRPSTQEEALALLTQYKQDAMIVAGGTDAVLRLTQKKDRSCRHPLAGRYSGTARDCRL